MFKYAYISKDFFNNPGVTAWDVLTRYCTYRWVRDISGPHTSDKWGNNFLHERQNQQKISNGIISITTALLHGITRSKSIKYILKTSIFRR